MDRTGVRYEIDRVDAASAPLIAAVMGDADSEPWDADSIARILAQPGVFGMVARGGGQPLGFLIARVAADESEIINLAVIPATRRRGIGSALVSAAMTQARSLGARNMFLEVADDNTAARALYERIGFMRVGIRPNYYARSSVISVNALILRCELVLTDRN